MARLAASPPFWSSSPTKPPKLRGSHAALMDAAEDGSRVHAYDRGRSYQVGELILHPTFGLGVVVGCPSPGRVEVRFETGDKLLACGVGDHPLTGHRA